MGFNLHNNKVKDLLLSEAIDRTASFKEAMFDKEAMPEAIGQRHLRNAINLSRVKIVPGPRVQQIAAAIEANFASFLRERIKIDGKSRLVSVKPGFKGPMSVDFADNIEVIAPSQQPGINNAVDQAGTGEQLPPPPQVNTDQLGHLYFRYGFTRTILPTEDQPEGQATMSALEEFQESIIDPLGVQTEQGGLFDILDFVHDLQTNKFAVVPAHNTSGVASYKLQQFIDQQSQSAPQSPNSQWLAKLSADSKRFMSRYNPQAQPTKPQFYTTGSKKTRSASSSKRGLNDVLAPDIERMTTESELGRVISFKIAAGYRLDNKGLQNTISLTVKDEIQKLMDKIEETTGNKEQAMLAGRQRSIFEWRRWKTQYNKMLSVYKAIEIWVESRGDRFQNEIRDYDAEMSKPEYLRNPQKMLLIHQTWGWSFRPKTEGTITGEGTEPNPASLRVYTEELPPIENPSPQYQELQDKVRRMANVPFDYKHMQMILQNLTIRSGPNKLKWDIDPDQFVDPSKVLQTYCDGFSDRLGQYEDEFRRAPLVPPVRETSSGIVFDPAGANLGLIHLRRNGEGVVRMLKKYGRAAKQLIQGLSKIDFKSIMDPDLKRVLYLYSRAFLGAEVLHTWLQSIQSPEQLSESLVMKREHRAGTPFDANTPMDERGATAFDYLKEYGYYVAKLMDIVRAIPYAKDTQEYVSDSGTRVTMHGGRYSTSSGVGGGGQILISVRYAFPCSLQEITGGDENLQQQYRRELRQFSPHDPRVLPSVDPARQTVHVPTSPERRVTEQLFQSPELVEQQPLEPGKPVRVVYNMGNMSFFLGLASSLPGHGSSMMQEVKTAKSWQECVSQLERMYRIGDVDISEDSGDFLSAITKDLDDLEYAIQMALTSVRNSITPGGGGIEIEIIDKNGHSEILQGGELPIPPEEEKIQAPTQGPAPQPEIGKEQEVAPPIVEAPGAPVSGAPVPGATPGPAPGETPLSQTPAEGPAPSRVRRNRNTLLKNPEGREVNKPAGVVQNKIVRLANEFDEKGLTEIANQLDYLLKEIIDME